MAIALGQTKTFGVAYGGSRTLAFDSAPAATDLVLVSAFIENENAITIPSGFTLLASHNNGSSYHHCAIAYKYGDTGNSYQFSWSGDAINYAWGATFTGVDATTPIDVQGTFDEANFTSLVLDSVTTTVDLAWHLLAAYHSNSPNFDTLTGYTRQFAAANCALYTKEISPAGSTGSKTVTVSGGTYYQQGLSFALRPAGAGGFNPLVRLRRLSAMSRMGQSSGMIRRRPL